MVLVGGGQFGGGGHGAKVVADVVAVAVGEPDVVVGETVGAVGVDGVGGPVQLADGFGFTQAILRFLAVEEFDGSVTGGVTLRGLAKDRLFVDGRDVPFGEVVVGEFLQSPIQNGARLLPGAGIPFGMFEEIEGESVGIDFGVGKIDGADVFKERSPDVCAERIGFEPGDGERGGALIFCGVALLEGEETGKEAERGSPVGGIGGGDGFAVFGFAMDFAGRGVDAEGPGGIVGVSGLNFCGKRVGDILCGLEYRGLLVILYRVINSAPKLPALSGCRKPGPARMSPS